MVDRDHRGSRGDRIRIPTREERSSRRLIVEAQEEHVALRVVVDERRTTVQLRPGRDRDSAASAAKAGIRLEAPERRERVGHGLHLCRRLVRRRHVLETMVGAVEPGNLPGRVGIVQQGAGTKQGEGAIGEQHLRDRVGNSLESRGAIKGRAGNIHVARARVPDVLQALGEAARRRAEDMRSRHHLERQRGRIVAAGHEELHGLRGPLGHRRPPRRGAVADVADPHRSLEARGFGRAEENHLHILGHAGKIDRQAHRARIRRSHRDLRRAAAVRREPLHLRGRGKQRVDRDGARHADHHAVSILEAHARIGAANFVDVAFGHG